MISMKCTLTDGPSHWFDFPSHVYRVCSLWRNIGQKLKSQRCTMSYTYMKADPDTETLDITRNIIEYFEVCMSKKPLPYWPIWDHLFFFILHKKIKWINPSQTNSPPTPCKGSGGGGYIGLTLFVHISRKHNSSLTDDHWFTFSCTFFYHRTLLICLIQINCVLPNYRVYIHILQLSSW